MLFAGKLALDGAKHELAQGGLGFEGSRRLCREAIRLNRGYAFFGIVIKC